MNTLFACRVETRLDACPCRNGFEARREINALPPIFRGAVSGARDIPPVADTANPAARPPPPKYFGKPLAHPDSLWYSGFAARKKRKQAGG